MGEKSRVVIIGSFGVTGVDQEDRFVEERKSMLNIARIKYIIEKKFLSISRRRNDDSERLKQEYRANPVYADIGKIAENTIPQIRDADVVVAIITRLNENVIFELATRAAFQRSFILLTDRELPIYLQDLARVSFDPISRFGEKMAGLIDEAAKDSSLENRNKLTWTSVKKGYLPETIKEAVDATDSSLQEHLYSAFKQIEDGKGVVPNFLQEVFVDLDPERFLDTWHPTLPISIIKISWRCKSHALEYDANDFLVNPYLCYWNDAYSRVFNIAYSKPTDQISADRLQQHVSEYMDGENYKLFEKDQADVARKSILGGQYATAKVPIEFNDSHPNCPGKVFLPTIIGKKVMASQKNNKDNLKLPHVMYIIVALIEDFFPLSELREKNPNLELFT